MTFTRLSTERLNAVARLSGPDPACLVATCRDDFVTLGIERNFTDLILVTLEDTCTSTSKDVVNSRHSVCTRSCQLIAG